jgi:hypothetical protein
MSELTDLEITERLMEIVGFKYEYALMNGKRVGEFNGELIEFNPLTDKALCFDLMVKYDVIYLDGCALVNYTTTGFYSDEDYQCSAEVINKDPQKAICLAIIEAHND